MLSINLLVMHPYQAISLYCISNFQFSSVVAIGFPTGGTLLSVTEGLTTTVSVCPQVLEGSLERQVSVFATTADISASGIVISNSFLTKSQDFFAVYGSMDMNPRGLTNPVG